MSPEEIQKQKEIQHYAASVNAWFNTLLEHDKSILSLSAGAIGLLVTLLTTVGVRSAEGLALYACALLSFTVSVASVVFVFQRNARHIENVLSEQIRGKDPVLSTADSVKTWAFSAGILLTALIGIATAFQSLLSKETSMANETKKTSHSTPLTESFNGLQKLQPNADQTRSFNGLSNLTPKAPAPSGSSGAATSSTPAPSSTGDASQGQNTPGK